MAARSVPILGFTAACIMVTAVGVAAITYGGDRSTRLSSAGVVIGTEAAPASRPVASPAQSLHPAQPIAAAHGAVTRSHARPTAPQRSLQVRPVSSIPSATPSSSAPAQPRLQPLAAQSDESNLAYARAVYQAINQARAGQHLPLLVWSSKLQSAARKHNAAMAAANTLDHQVGREPALGARETAAGVQWTFAAENIGWTTAQSRSGALAIEASMFAETPPTDAHRRNILSTSAHAVGVDVLIDAAHGRFWLTEDFADVA
jgi:uncharacterized protein YkwD